MRRVFPGRGHSPSVISDVLTPARGSGVFVEYLKQIHSYSGFTAIISLLTA